MRLMDPSDWAAEGRVTVWEPSDRMMSTLSAKETVDQPLSFLQADHVRSVMMNRVNGGTHKAYTASAIHLPYPVDAERLTQSVNEFLGAHEGLRCTIAVSDTELDQATGQPAIERKLLAPEEVAMQANEVDEADITGDAAEWLRGYFSRTAVSDNVPALAIAVVENAEEKTADLVLALDHAVGDGLSQAIGVLEIASRYLGQQTPLTMPQQPSFLDYVKREHEVASAVPADSPGTQLWEECINFVGGVPKLDLALGVENNEPQEVTPLQSDGPLADADDLQKLRAVAKSKGYSFSTVLYSILGLAHARCSGNKKYATVTVSSTRGMDYPLSQGWFCNFNPLFFTVEGNSVFDNLDNVAAAQKRMKATLAEPVHASLNNLVTLGKVGPEIFQSPQMVTYMDLSWFQEPEGADLRIFGGLGKTKNANFWAARNPEGLVIGSQAPNNPTARKSLAEFFAEAQKIVKETVAHVEA